MGSLNRAKDKTNLPTVENFWIIDILPKVYICFKYSVFKTYNMRNVSFNFITQVVSRLEIWGIKSGLLTDICAPSARCKQHECGNYNTWGTPLGYGFTGILLEVLCSLNFFLRTVFTVHSTFQLKTCYELDWNSKNLSDQVFCPHFPDKENEAQRG